MGTRRMLTTKITDDDRFVTLPSSAQALYLHLSMSADDDGFNNQVASSMFKAHATTADLGMLLERKYLYQFDDGVIVIKHWRMANALRKDRYTPTTFQEDLAKLNLDENSAYTMSDVDGCRLVAKRLPQDKLSKDKLSKGNSITRQQEHKESASARDEKKYTCMKVVDMYHEECPSLPKVRSLSDERKKHILARLKEHSMDELRLAFQKAEASDWCTGRSGDWKCNLEWMMKSENNLLKILEGNYDNRNSIKEKTISDMRKITEGMTAEEYAEMEKEFR